MTPGLGRAKLVLYLLLTTCSLCPTVSGQESMRCEAELNEAYMTGDQFYGMEPHPFSYGKASYNSTTNILLADIGTRFTLHCDECQFLTTKDGMKVDMVELQCAASKQTGPYLAYYFDDVEVTSRRIDGCFWDCSINNALFGTYAPEVAHFTAGNGSYENNNLNLTIYIVAQTWT